nr:pentatricopeptide repeat-containing protein [Tanacetum cinerariifolium]
SDVIFKIHHNGVFIEYLQRYENATVICFPFVGVTRDVNIVVVDKGNVGDGNIVHKGNVSDTNLVDKALVDNVGETKEVMLVVDNVVNSNLVDNGTGVSIDDGVLAKQMKLDKGKENDNPSFDSDSDSDSENENHQENQVNSFGNETNMVSESDESEKSFDYLSDCDYEFRECLTYYALENGFSLWFYKSYKNKMIAKCGQREEKIKDPSKEKQRSYKKFPSNNAHKTFCPWRCYGNMLKTENSFQIRSYGKALYESNKGSTIIIGVTVNPDENTYFNRELLTAVGRDENNYIFHVAWAVVTIENKYNWSWLIELLADDLEISNGFGLTLMSYRHKDVATFRPKKKKPSENTNEIDEVEIVNNAIDEFERATSTNHVVFTNEGRIELGKNWNKIKRGAKSDGTSFVKMIRGKTNRGRLIPTQRLGRLERWLGMDVGTSNPESEPLHASFLGRNNNNNINDAMNVESTQQSQVVGVHGPRYKTNQGTKVRMTKIAIIYRMTKTTSATSANPQPRQ